MAQAANRGQPSLLLSLISHRREVLELLPICLTEDMQKPGEAETC